ncbi:MAG: putative lipid II flippase FtsW [Lachnospiraceae bacterium]|nr:putative lipid II flippase FtsW [Lachnospiraceae bacterium]
MSQTGTYTGQGYADRYRLGEGRSSHKDGREAGSRPERPSAKQEAASTAKPGQKTFVDRSLIFIVLFLLCFGLIMIYSASSYAAMRQENDSAYFLKSQIRATILGLVGMIIMSRVNYHLLRKAAWPAYVGSLILILLVLTPLGMTKNGARRWLNLGLSLQPAEVAKVGMIIFFAAYICANMTRIGKMKGMIQTFLWALPPCAFVYFITDNLSTAIIIFGIVYVMMFIASPRSWPYVVAAIVIVLLAVSVVYAVEHNILPSELSYRLARIKIWRNPESDAGNKGFQTLQALYSIGSGGFLGKGLGQSTQKYRHLPEAQNDMIFAIVCEELGIFGALAVMLLFALLIWHFLHIANNAPDLFGSLLVTGVLTHFALQVVLNIAVVTNLLPNTGITLPFISYGGSSTLFLLVEIGIVLSVSRSIKLE